MARNASPTDQHQHQFLFSPHTALWEAVLRFCFPSSIGAQRLSTLLDHSSLSLGVSMCPRGCRAQMGCSNSVQCLWQWEKMWADTYLLHWGAVGDPQPRVLRPPILRALLPAMGAGKGRFGEAEPANGKANSFPVWAHPDPRSVTPGSPTQPQGVPRVPTLPYISIVPQPFLG